MYTLSSQCRRRQSLGFFLSLVAIVGTLCAFLPRIVTAKEEFYILLPININTADALTLSRALSGVGPKKAAAIIAYRENHGQFESLHELLQVKGIGPGTLDKNRSRISLE